MTAPLPSSPPDQPLRHRLARHTGGYTEWVRLTDTALLALSLLFLGLLVVQETTRLTPTEKAATSALGAAIWAAFAVDYVVRLYLALDRRRYVRANVLDLLIVLVPFLRPVRVLRALRLLRLAALGGLAQRRVASLHARVSAYLASTATVLVVVAATAMYDVEHSAPGATIRTLPDAFWWAATTVTTVGYGDRYPVTPAGRGIAIALMVVGIALIGVITASIAAWFVGRVTRVAQEERASATTLDDVLVELARLHVRLDQLTASPARPDGGQGSPATAEERPPGP